MTRRLTGLALVAAVVTTPAVTSAQTDYYNTDAGRPITIEDAHPLERYGLELQVAPLRLSRAGGANLWGVEPELAYGILPRTHLEVGVPLAWRDPGGVRTQFGLAGIEVGMLHNLNVETTTLPAFAVAAELLAPVGALAPANASVAFKGIATRTLSFARIHVNGQYALGEAAVDPASGAHAPPRWLAGVAVDRVLPLRSMLLTADLVAERPMLEGHDVEWNAGAGMRWQRSPRWALDAGGGLRLGAERAWFVTTGAAYAFGIRSLIPVRRGGVR